MRTIMNSTQEEYMVFEKVKAIIADQLDINEEDKIEMDSLLVEDLGMDSIDSYDLLIAVQEEFDIEISNDDIADLKTNMKTVGDIVRYVEDAQ